MNASRFLLIGPLAFLIFLFVPTTLSPAQQNLGAIMMWVVSWWLNPIAPLAVTGLIGVVLSVVLGVAPVDKALDGFSNPVIFLFMGGFFLAHAMRLHQLDLWIAQKCLSSPIIRGRPVRVLIAVTVLTATFSMIISNTATTAMFYPIVLSVFARLQTPDDHPSFLLLLLVAYASSIGGIGTPLGSPPNVIGLSLLEGMTGQRISFLEWMAYMAPVMLVFLAFLFLVFNREFRLLPEGKHQFEPPTPMTSEQKWLSAVLSLAVLLWVLPGFMQLVLGADHAFAKDMTKRLPESMVAIGTSSLLFFIKDQKGRGLMSWREAEGIDWGTLLLFGAGISLGQMMFDTGLTPLLGQKMPFASMPFWLSLFVIVSVTVFGSELMSNTAITNLLVPLVISTPPFNSNPVISVLCVTLAGSLAFMLPVGTPPNAIIFGSGKIKLPWMLRKGLYLNLFSIFIIWCFGMILF